MKIGDAVTLVRYEKGGIVSYPANLLTLPDSEGRAQIYFYHPDRSRHLGGADWRDAIDRAVDVLPKEKAGDFIAYWTDPQEEMTQFVSAHNRAFEQNSATIFALRDEVALLTARLAATTEGVDERLQSEADKYAAQPSAADLDADAEEKDAKEATNGKKARPVASGK